MTLNQKINNIDDEWSSFLSNPSTFDEYYEETNNENTDFDCEEDKNIYERFLNIDNPDKEDSKNFSYNCAQRHWGPNISFAAFKVP